MRWTWLLPLLSSTAAAQAQPSAPVTPAFVETQLHRLAADYARDPMIVDVTFGVDVDGTVWTVDADPARDGRAAAVRVTRGAPTVPTWVDSLSGATFRNIVEGRMTALTASVRARASDVTLMNARMVNGMSRDAVDESGLDRAVLAHFWTTGLPEIIPFGFASAKEAHGGQVSVLQYAGQLRSGWWGILPGQHVNRDPDDQTNPFPSLIIVQRAGSGRARIGGHEFALRDQTMIIVPAGMPHELWNPGSEPAEGILIMYGVGA